MQMSDEIEANAKNLRTVFRGILARIYALKMIREISIQRLVSRIILVLL